MAKQTFTQAELDQARQALEDLPDLSRQKISQADMLASLKEQIVLLSSSKGYSVAEIKAALASVGVTVTTKAISDMVATRKRAQGRKKAETGKTDSPET
ncbi:mobilization protein (plasmid) [Pseudomonas sp. HR96]|uniref:mobilization protein n=1 Tax=Pseudomonas sp. HR96 TaxID=1027966 RepID=UPI002A753396|nr:mobilization protein [Pseudomonas sp. HR96]WPP02553.1 mobilization protein [Pseudomonas sp. HR96]